MYSSLLAAALANQLNGFAAARFGKQAGTLQQAEAGGPPLADKVSLAVYDTPMETAAQGFAAAREGQEAEALLHRPKQIKRRRMTTSAPRNKTDLAFVHVPYNFGHTIELHALVPSWLLPSGGEGVGVNSGNRLGWSEKIIGGNFTPALARSFRLFYRKDPQFWGHLNPELNTISEVTGCPMYFTPQKYWPQELALRYFGENKTIFGMIRSPYERLSAFFRGEFSNYGGAFPEYYKSCDVNGAIKLLMKEVLQTNNTFQKSCSMLPQAEYFDGKYGINLALDSRKFPRNANDLFAAHHSPVHIKQSQIAHVKGCDNAWSGDFDAETKGLIRRVFKRDFQLLCELFGYCDELEDSCMPGVPQMCPERHFAWDGEREEYVRRQ